MAKNLVQKDGRYISLPIPSKLSGDPAMLGGIRGVCLTDTDANGMVAIDRGPAVYDLEVKAVSDSGNSEVAIGDMLFYAEDDTPRLSKKVNGMYWGYALEPIAAGATATINVLCIDAP